MLTPTNSNPAGLIIGFLAKTTNRFLFEHTSATSKVSETFEIIARESHQFWIMSEMFTRFRDKKLQKRDEDSIGAI